MASQSEKNDGEWETDIKVQKNLKDVQSQRVLVTNKRFDRPYEHASSMTGLHGGRKVIPTRQHKTIRQMVLDKAKSAQKIGSDKILDADEKQLDLTIGQRTKIFKSIQQSENQTPAEKVAEESGNLGLDGNITVDIQKEEPREKIQIVARDKQDGLVRPKPTQKNILMPVPETRKVNYASMSRVLDAGVGTVKKNAITNSALNNKVNTSLVAGSAISATASIPVFDKQRKSRLDGYQRIEPPEGQSRASSLADLQKSAGPASGKQVSSKAQT